MKWTKGQIRAVTFDAGGTLLEPRGSVGQIYAEVAAEHGAGGLSPKRLTRRFRAAWRRRGDFNHTRAEWAEVVDATFNGLTPVPPSCTFFGELYQRFAEPEAWRVYPDVVPALEMLVARGFKLAVISNWDHRLRPLLRRLGLLKHFRAVVVSCEVGFAKPSPAVFDLAARQLDYCPDGILHLGDDLTCDVHGARAAGFQALRIDRGARPGSVVAQIVSLHALQELR